MTYLGVYIFNANGTWLQEDRKSWGPFESAHDFSGGTGSGGEDEAETVREALPGDEVTYTMAALH